ncbi:bifunctional phosphoribosyl-AMP cyclohydrolase/phosphoribosyl-ATP diphosphatase HisIE [Ornithinimicrobium sp. Arc0846-15]|nr:bifunctional phosphoribosyl-AMP cyclohydrolase/phosphoribosyl-ATP diphosphatase HisIE [Ornithinimicrobium laminariae]
MTALSLPNGLALEDLAFDKQDGLLPGVVQHADTGEVLMVGYLDRDAVQQTLETGLASFYSRSRQTSWVKGETSGNTLSVRSIAVDCDNDTLLLISEPAGPTCHTGAHSCFGEAAATVNAGAIVGEASAVSSQGSFVSELNDVVKDRHEQRPAESYTTSLFDSGVRRIAQKVGEEGVETALAGVVQNDEALLGESADLIYHLLVLLRERGLGLEDVEAVLRARHS